MKLFITVLFILALLFTTQIAEAGAPQYQLNTLENYYTVDDIFNNYGHSWVESLDQFGEVQCTDTDFIWLTE